MGISGQWADRVISTYHSNTLVNNYLILPLPPPSICPRTQRSAKQASAEIRVKRNNEGLYSELLPWKETEKLLYMVAFKQQPGRQLQKAWTLPTLGGSHKLLKQDRKQNLHFHKLIVNPCLDVEYCSKNNERKTEVWKKGSKCSKASINEYL